MRVSEREEIEDGLFVRARGAGETRGEAANDCRARLYLVEHAIDAYREDCLERGECPYCDDYEGDGVKQHVSSAHPGRHEG